MAQEPPRYRVASAGDRTGADPGPAWTNRLIDETSPYLLQHAHNPVDWYPWGDEAFERARDTDRPILLSIGYAACHWCHVMEHESFSDPDVAAWLNERFVPIKVDREERPDVDAIYIQALSALQGQAGWPANLFLLPDLRPFAGATYLPPAPRYGMPSFRQVLERVHGFWTRQRGKLETTGAQLVQALSRTLPPADRGPDLEGFREAVRQVVSTQDPQHGGHGQGQKFPQTPSYELLLLGAADEVEGAGPALAEALLAMASAGLYDHLGGGFHRYCVDRAWTVPHFEKMLYDNAQLLRLYARAARQLSSDHPALARRCVRVVRETVHYLHRDLQGDRGAFWSSEDADDPQGEGFFYTFTPDEAREALGVEGPLPYGIRPGGNFEHGRTVLSTRDGRPPEPIRQRLLAWRDRRERPPTDTKRVVAWNGLALGALAEAGRLLGFDDWIDAAARCAELLLDTRRDDGTWPRLLEGDAPGTLEDHADLADGLIDLFQARPHELRWLEAARTVVQAALDTFADPEGGLLYQSADRPDLVVRRRDVQDGSEPSGNGRMAAVLRRLLAYGADLDRAVLDDLIADASGFMDRAPLATPELWGVVRALAAPPRELVIAGPPDHPTTLAMLRVWNRTWRPQGLVAVVPGDSEAGERWSLLAERTAADDGGPRAYLCRGGTCRLPVDSAEGLADLLEADDGRA